MLDVNVVALCLVAKLAVLSMRERKVDDGHIVNICSWSVILVYVLVEQFMAQIHFGVCVLVEPFMAQIVNSNGLSGSNRDSVRDIQTALSDVDAQVL
ncbi:hypothetical protein Avbf_12764 [Armadillidium vulgare]|nr:hypothetical protein Avbf_12764 [Armadillidium vulgare]